MYLFLFKWFIASLVMPTLVLLFGKFLNNYMILWLWPSSLALMSLGAGESSRGEVIFIWFVAVFLNAVLYVFIGAVTYFIRNYFRF